MPTVLDLPKRLQLGLRLFIVSVGLLVVLVVSNFMVAVLTPGPDWQTASWRHDGVAAFKADGTRELISHEYAEAVLGDAWSLWLGPLPAALWATATLGMGLCCRNLRKDGLFWVLGFFALLSLSYAVTHRHWVGGPWMFMAAPLAACALGLFALHLHELDPQRVSGERFAGQLAGAGCVLPMLAVSATILLRLEIDAVELLICAPLVFIYLTLLPGAVRLIRRPFVSRSCN